MIKISLLLLYRRIFPNRKFHIAVYILIAINVLWCLAFFFRGIWNCVPIRGFWDASVSARCWNFKSSTIAYAVTNLSTDVLVLALPVRTIWRLHLSGPRKIALTLIFMLGSFDTLAALIRLLSAATHDNDPDVTCECPFEMTGNLSIWPKHACRGIRQDRTLELNRDVRWRNRHLPTDIATDR